MPTCVYMSYLYNTRLSNVLPSHAVIILVCDVPEHYVIIFTILYNCSLCEYIQVFHVMKFVGCNVEYKSLCVNYYCLILHSLYFILIVNIIINKALNQ